MIEAVVRPLGVVVSAPYEGGSPPSNSNPWNRSAWSFLSPWKSARAIAAVEEHGHLLSQLGFDVEAFGANSLIVRSVPHLVAQGNDERAFGNLLDELVSGHAGSGLEEKRDALLAMLACKNAIKAGDPLPMEAMQRLVNDLPWSKTRASAPPRPADSLQDT